MAVEIKVTPAGESITHATLLRWLKPEGSAVKAGEPVCELETDKATKEEFAPASGVLAIQVQPGTRVPIGAVIGFVDPSRTAAGAAPTARAPSAKPPAHEGNSVATSPQPDAAPRSDLRLSPAARVLVDSQGIDVSRVPASPQRRGDQKRCPHLPGEPAAPHERSR